MKKKLIFSTILFIIALGLSVFLLVDNKSSDSNGSPPVGNSQIVLFYGEGCPHCVIVEEYIEKNAIKGKISFE